MADNVIPPEKWNSWLRREALLTRRRRIRRDRDIEAATQYERELGLRYPHGFTLPTGLKVEYRRGGRHNLNQRAELEPSEDDYDDRMWVRQTFAWLSRDGERVGFIELRVFDLPWAFNPLELAQVFDDEAEDLGVLAETLLSAWEEMASEVAAYGDIVELHAVWTVPGKVAPGEWIAAAERLVAERRRKKSVLILHAFPFEYGGRADEHDASRVGFERRRLAMLRAAAGFLGVTPFPGLSGQEGWMWRPYPRVADIIPEPGYDPEWRDADRRRHFTLVGDNDDGPSR